MLERSRGRTTVDRNGLPVLITEGSTWLRRSLFYDQWNIGISDSTAESILSGEALARIKWLPRQRSGIIIADPFLVEWHGRQLILCEVYDYRLGRGRIGAIPLDSPSAIEIVIDLPVHLAFPFPILHRGKLYCIPESLELGEVAAYDISDFSRPRRAAILLKGVAGCDCAVVEFAGSWWMFGTDAQDGPFDKLRIWYANDLMGPWYPHALNPVKVGLEASRSAGPPFVWNGALYRPAQDCSEGYGSRVVINRVEKLTRTEFEENPVGVISPDPEGPYPDGLHTLSPASSGVLVDGRRRQSIFRSLPVLIHRARRLLRPLQSS